MCTRYYFEIVRSGQRSRAFELATTTVQCFDKVRGIQEHGNAVHACKGSHLLLSIHWERVQIMTWYLLAVEVTHVNSIVSNQLHKFLPDHLYFFVFTVPGKRRNRISKDECYMKNPQTNQKRIYFAEQKLRVLLVYLVRKWRNISLRSVFLASRFLFHTAFTSTKLKKTQGGRYSCIEQPFDELKSAFCSTIYISKQRKFVPLFDSGGTLSIRACAKEISPEIPCSVLFWSYTPCNFDQTTREKGKNDEGKT